MPPAKDADASGGDEPVRQDDVLAAWSIRRDQHVAHNAVARQQFNDAVAQYNRAIAQFPANVLAWLFGFQKARPL